MENNSEYIMPQKLIFDKITGFDDFLSWQENRKIKIEKQKCRKRLKKILDRGIIQRKEYYIKINLATF